MLIHRARNSARITAAASNKHQPRSISRALKGNTARHTTSRATRRSGDTLTAGTRLLTLLDRRPPLLLVQQHAVRTAIGRGYAPAMPGRAGAHRGVAPIRIKADAAPGQMGCGIRESDVRVVLTIVVKPVSTKNPSRPDAKASAVRVPVTPSERTDDGGLQA
jgi:hypothetical protein